MSETEPTGHNPEDGQLPEGWKLSPIGVRCKVVSGSTPKTSVPEYWGGDIPWLTPDDLSKNRSKIVERGARLITPTGLDSCSTRLVPKGSVMFTSRAPIGYVAIAANEMCTNQGFKTAVPGPDLRSEFLYWQLQHVTPDIRSRASGTTFLEISGKGFAATEIVIPPLVEQERIVEILEEQLSRLDAALESVRVVREKAAQFRRSLLHAAFTGTLTGHNPEDGQLPEGWGISSLGQVATLSLGKMLDRKQFTGLHPVPYLRNINVRWDKVDCGDLQEMDITPEQLPRVSLCPGDLVVCEGGEPGRAAVWNGTESIAIQKALHRVRPVDSVNPRFLYFVFEAEFRGVEEHPLFTGTTIKHLPKEKISAVSVPLPPLAEQVRIVGILEEQLSRLDAALAVADVIEKRSAALRRSLLHAAFTGRLTEHWRESVHV